MAGPVNFLVTGVGRSGTGWAASLFNTLGFDCGHERWHHTSPYEGMGGPDSSWLAIPRLPEIPPGTRVIRLVRDPLAVVRSAVSMRFLARHNDYMGFVHEHRPDITRADDHLTRVIRWVSSWDAPLDDHPHHLLRIEDSHLVAAAVAYATGQVVDAAEALAAVGTTTNTHRHRSWLTWDDIRQHPEGPALIERARRFGYEVN